MVEKGSVPITDDFMKSAMTRTRPYTVMLLHRTPAFGETGARAIVWEHGRRNFQLRAEGTLAIVVPIPEEGSPIVGIGIFTTSVEETTRIMQEDPGVKAGIFTFGVRGGRSFPGGALP